MGVSTKYLEMRSQVWEIRAVLIADRAHRAGRLGHDCVHVVREQVQWDFPFVAYLQVDVFELHPLYHPCCFLTCR